MNSLSMDAKKTALVVIDLQNRIVALPCAPYSSRDVVLRAAKLVQAFRDRGAFVGLVRVASTDGKDMLKPITDQPLQASGAAAAPTGANIVDEIGVKESDHLVTKRQWGAFYGTDLDLQLRRRGIDTIVLCGIATGIGVDTTAREAYQLGYNQIFASDAMTGLSEEEHHHVLQRIFPRIGRIRTTDEILAGWSE